MPCKGAMSGWSPWRAQSLIRIGAAEWVAAAAAAAGVISEITGNKQRKEQAQNQIDFQREMSNTAFQRQKADLLAAGFNPMLGFMQGSGASTPSGAQAEIRNPIATGVSSASQAMQTAQAFQQMSASRTQQEQMVAQTEKIRSETVDQSLNSAKLASEIAERKTRTDAEQQKILGYIADSATKHAAFEAANRGGAFEADVERRKAEARRSKSEADISRYDVDRAKAESKFFGSDIGGANPYIRQIMDVLKGLSSARGALR